MRKRKQTTPLLSALTVSMLCASLASTASAHSIYQKYNTDGWSQPTISVLMQALSNHDYPWKDAIFKADSGNSDIPPAGQPGAERLPDGFIKQPDPTGSGSEDGSNMQSGTANPDNLSDESSDNSGSDNQSSEKNSPVSPGHSDPAEPDPAGSQQENGTSDSESAPPPEPKQYEFTDVTQEYFDDALLIGDSRAEGVKLYSGWDNITYYAEGGMTIYNMFQRQVTDEDGNKLSIEDALQKHIFGKIYLEIGINEMGTGTVDSFMAAYEEAVNHLRELQPDAILYVCGIMYVKQNKSESDPIFNNPNIQARNDRIAQLADGENIFYLDINELVADETGNLNPDYTWDEIHLLGKYDSLWLDYFCSHGIVRE